jgi:hypothetical protein
LTATGCMKMGQSPKPLPPRPTLESAKRNDQGGICLDRSDTKELMHYLDKLERH